MIWRPWKRIRELSAALDRVTAERDALNHALHQSADRYDNIRNSNAQLREALALYRSEY